MMILAALFAAATTAAPSPTPLFAVGVEVTATHARADSPAWQFVAAEGTNGGWCVDGDGVGESVTITLDRPWPIDAIGIIGHESAVDGKQYSTNFPLKVELETDAKVKHVFTRKKLEEFEWSAATDIPAHPTTTLTFKTLETEKGARNISCFGAVRLEVGGRTIPMILGVKTPAIEEALALYQQARPALASCDAAALEKVAGFPLTFKRYVSRAPGKPKNRVIVKSIIGAADLAKECSGSGSGEAYPEIAADPILTSEEPGKISFHGKTKDSLWWMEMKRTDGHWKIVFLSKS